MTDETETKKSEKPKLRLVGVNDEMARNALVKRAFSNEEASGATASNAFESEDEYQQFYLGGSRDAGVLAPPFTLRQLDWLSQENNTLSPCIEAMVTNIDGTGYDFEKDSDDKETDEEDGKIDELTAFFDEPWPGQSFITMRKELRRDYERTGNCYIEVLRNPADKIVFIRRIDAKMMRILKLDVAVPVDQKLIRGGKEVVTKVMRRERRFCQVVNGVTMVYFKEFGASRDLDKSTGKWHPTGQKLPAQDRATEIIHLTNLPDAYTPYGVPRWINQVPSVLGSRKAEEFNLEFFDAGGVPPAMIILQGGALQEETRKALENKMVRGDASQKNRIQVLEVEPTSGSTDNPGSVRVTVERFGAERQNDSMFEAYDGKCSERIRRAFRLPPIFLGHAEDYSFASAATSYQVAEAQVFKPERDEFDEVISMKLLPAMGYAGYKMVSKPLVIENAILKLQAIQVAQGTNRVDPEDIITELNEAAGTKMKVTEEPVNQPVGMPMLDENGQPIPGQPAPFGQKPGAGAKPPEDGKAKPEGPAKPQQGAPGQQPAKGESIQKPSMAAMMKGVPDGVYALAHEALTSLRKRDFIGLARNMQLAKGLTPKEQADFKKACAAFQFHDPSFDIDGIGELASCTLDVMGHGHTH